MTPINFHKKEKPLTSLVSMGGGAAGMQFGGAGDKYTYLDDVFSTYAYYGNSTEGHVINNGIDLAGEGGFVWIKKRSGTDNHVATHVPETVLFPNTDGAPSTGNPGFISSFNSNGFTLGGGVSGSNASGETTAAWTWRKAPGFLDVVTYTGNGNTPQAIAHNLGSMPGMVIVKKTSGSGDWMVWHRDLNGGRLELNQDGSAGSGVWGGAEPTSTHFSVAGATATGENGSTYVAYLFAGGASSAATARSVNFDGSSDYLKFEASSSGIAVGTGNFTCEFWVKLNADVTGNDALIDTRTSAMNTTNGFQIYLGSNRAVFGYVDGDMFGGTTKILSVGTWNHVAVVRSASALTTLYVNGCKAGADYLNVRDFSNSEMVVGANSGGATESNVKISNLRLTKGQALYTSSFTPTYEPLTTTSQGAIASNVKILACNNSSVTGGTVVPAVAYTNSATASTDSPFDDPEGYKFGADENKNIIKTGGYIGNGSATGPTVDIGWEPQYLLIKNTVGGATQNWRLLDAMRGLDYDGGADQRLYPSQNGTESASNIINPISRGFKLTTTDASVNGSGESYMYIAVRRPDGDVGKPVVAASKSFAIDYGNGSSTIPAYNSTFPVDYGLEKRYNQTYDWWSSSRITGGTYVRTSSNVVQSGPNTEYCWDSMEGYVAASWANSATIAYMFRRGKGVDVVPYTGDGVQGRSVPHSLGQTPQMIWIKSRTSVTNWATGHIGLNGGTNPWNYYVQLDTTLDQNGSFAGSDNVIWGDGAPSATNFNIGSNSSVNTSGENYVAMLFADENDINDNPISKVGYFDGSDSANPINFGFSPRFFLLKNIDATEYWPVRDTLRGFDKQLAINNANPESTVSGWVTPTASGVTLVGNQLPVNKAGNRYIYYAHA